MTILKSAGSLLLFALPLAAQQPSSQPQSSPPSDTHSQVLFSHSGAAQPHSAEEAGLKATDADRSAITFTGYDLDVHLTPHQQSLEVLATLSLRNDSSQPVRVVPLQLSSSLRFEQIAQGGVKLIFPQQMLDSDEDHTGQLREADAQLPRPLAPGDQTTLSVLYGGPIPLTAERLLRIGTPGDLAEQSDWDRISEDFTGLRGFGNVVWYPVSSVAARFGDGARVFDEVGRQKLRQSAATLRIRLTVEFYTNPPAFAILDGRYVEMGRPEAMPTGAFPGVVRCELPSSTLGFAAPSMFLADRTLREGDSLRVLARPVDEADVQGYLTAMTMLQPLAKQWFGDKATGLLTVLDLPEHNDSPAEEGSALLTSLIAAEPAAIADTLPHSLARAAFSSPRQWLDEGVANFFATLWLEQTKGRDTALGALDSARGALALAEPATPGDGPGEDLLHASQAIYYRTKAAYVLWMLRGSAGDTALAAALQQYDPKADTAPEYFERLIEKTSHKNLDWLFDDWVYHDRGLPDLSIGGVFPAHGAHLDEYVVAVDIANAGYARAEVPVTVRSVNSSLTERVLVPAHGSVTHRMLVNGTPQEVIVNDGSVPEVRDSVHRLTITNLPANPAS